MTQLKNINSYNTDKLRSFIAIETNEKLEGLVNDLIERFQRMGFKANWTKAKNVHLTLFFLGDQKMEKIAQLAYKIGERISGFPTFHFNIHKMGFFENDSEPKVLWLGIQEDNTLIGLYEEIKKVLKISELEVKDTNFLPHITVGRVKSFPNHWKELINSVTFDQIQVYVNSIGIYSSELTRRGPIYKKLYTVDFEGGVIING